MQDGTTVHIIALDTWRINGGDTYLHYDLHSKDQFIYSREHVEEGYAQGELSTLTYEALLKMPSMREDMKTRLFQEMDDFGYLPSAVDEEQLQWLNNTLQHSTADWKIVIG